VRHLRRIALASAGVLVALVVVELGFRVRDHGAFPHLNLYRADAQLGVRLLPGATEKISFSRNPVSRVRINQAGYRGPEWPARAEGEILVVGDSQAFGLGVDEADAFAWRLGERLHRPVANAAVPTYGPEEYNAVLAELLPSRRPRTVVYTINLANDLFESAHRNTTRHAVWDGWAVRKEHAPSSVAWFPGRSLLYRHSHAFFALRGLWFQRHGGADEAAVPSEGSWRDLVDVGKQIGDEQAQAHAAHEAERKKRDETLRQARQEIRKLDQTLGDAIAKAIPDEGEDFPGAGTLRTARANPGDIVRVYYGEGSQPIPALAAEIQKAAALRKKFEDKLRAERDEATLQALARRDALDDELKALRAAPEQALRSRSPLRPHLERARKLCAEHGAELVVLVLPLDVQVSRDEWKKYGKVAALDMTATRVLMDDVLALAEELGARAVDGWPVLAAAEPGAFLDGDLHMTPRGHDAIATALARTLSGPAVRPSKLPSLPLGRSAVPTPQEWARAAPPPDDYDLSRSELRRAGCTILQVREWWKLSCPDSRLWLEIPGRGGPLVVNTDEGSSVVAPTIEGDRFQLRIFGKKTWLLRVEWALGEPRFSSFMYDTPAKREAPVPSEAERSLCACHKEVHGAADCTSLYGAAEAGCDRAYARDCRARLACARGDASAPPACLDGERPTDVTHRCVPAEHAAR
jgi:hypothetical protein